MTANKFLTQLEEKKLFKLLKQYLFSDLIDLNEEDQYSPVDWYQPSTNEHYECKCRNEHYSALVIEKKKYIQMLEYEKPIYLNSTPKGIFGFYLKELEEPVWADKLMNRTFEFGERVYIPKDSGMILISKCHFQLDHLLLPKLGITF